MRLSKTEKELLASAGNLGWWEIRADNILDAARLIDLRLATAEDSCEEFRLRITPKGRKLLKGKN